MPNSLCGAQALVNLLATGCWALACESSLRGVSLDIHTHTRTQMAGPQCCVPAPACEHESHGSEEVIGPFLSYISHPSLAAAPKAAVILVSDVFGFKTPLLRKLADKVAALGYMVVVPDYFNNDPYVPDAAMKWFEKHQPIDVVGSTKSLVEVLKNKGLSLVGAVGFCWGAKVVVELAKEDHLKVAITCHPSLMTVEDIRDVRTPMAILAAEVDNITPPALVEQYREILDSKEDVPSFVKIYKGTVHGWVVRYDVNNAKEVEMAEEAHQKVFEWLNMYLQ